MDGRIPITTRIEFKAALRDALVRAADHGCRELYFCDDRYVDWPLNEPAVIDELTRWAAASRRLIVLARDYDAVLRSHPRWVQWRRQWAHVVHCRANRELHEGGLPCLLLAPGTRSVRLIDANRQRGFASDDPVDTQAWRELLDAVLQRSEEAFAATTLGL